MRFRAMRGASLIATALGAALFRALVLSRILVAQTPHSGGSQISGRVLDAQGQPIGGATVSLARNGAPQGALRATAADGTYTFTDLEPGVDYEVKAATGGLASRVRPVRPPEAGARLVADLVVVSPIQFQDASLKSGLNFVLRNGASGHFYQPEIMLGGVAALDYNNDGCTDIFFSNGAEASFRNQNRTGVLQPPLPQ